jgi:hypothetical protein
MSANRRQFSRIRFRTDARLYLPGQEADVEIVDLSLRGALVAAPPEVYAPLGTPCTLRLRLHTALRVLLLREEIQRERRGILRSTTTLDFMRVLRAINPL